jgi:hypothetical protein
MHSKCNFNQLNGNYHRCRPKSAKFNACVYYNWGVLENKNKRKIKKKINKKNDFSKLGQNLFARKW